jgi:hypothetical protein
MPRGQYWHATYDPRGTDPTQDFDLDGMANTVGPVDYVIKDASGLPKIAKITFRGCDFKGKYSKLTFGESTFEDCNFNGGTWTEVKFSKCKFQKCHIAITEFAKCTFLECTFDGISVSAEHLKLERTSIQAAPFLSAVITNNDHLPQGTTAETQNRRLRITLSKVARTILSSTRDEPDPDLYFEAYKEFMVRYLRAKRDRQWDPKQTPKRRLLPRLFFTGVVWVEHALTVTAGYLTDWGRSIMRPLFFAAAQIVVFAVVYRLMNGKLTYLGSLAKSVDVTTVAGYTRYPTQGLERLATTINMLLGLYWYSLLIPTVVKRTLR